MGIHIIHLHLGRAGHLENAVALAGFAESGLDGTQHHAHVAADGGTLDLLFITECRAKLDLYRFTFFQDGEVRILDFHKKTFAGLEFFGVPILVANRRAHLFQRGNGAPVMPLLEVAEANVIVGLIHLLGNGESLDHLPHDLEALAIMAPFKKTNAHL